VQSFAPVQSFALDMLTYGVVVVDILLKTIFNNINNIIAPVQSFALAAAALPVGMFGLRFGLPRRVTLAARPAVEPAAGLPECNRILSGSKGV
jgi:hypothetical protein